MVRLNRIYTRTGDAGQTGLGDGSRVAKDDPRIAAYGTVDELGAALGCVLSQAPTPPRPELLRRIQNDLFDVGADLCRPGAPDDGALRVTAKQVRALETAIDELNAPLPALESFVLAGGTAAATGLHLARTICRRAEREAVTLARVQPVSPEVLRYLNRLSDLLFVLARVANDGGAGDVLWRPGEHR